MKRVRNSYIDPDRVVAIVNVAHHCRVHLDTGIYIDFPVSSTDVYDLLFPVFD